MEKWKQWKNTKYYVSDFGRVFSFYKKERFGCGILIPYGDGHGYLTVSLNGKKYKIHRLVAELFIPNPENKEEVNHKDCDTTKNYAYNLEWATPLENMKHASKMKVIRNQTSPNNKVAKYDLDGNFIQIFDSPFVAAKDVGVKNARSINDVCRFKQKTFKNYMWRYILNSDNFPKKIQPLEIKKSSLTRKIGKYDLNDNLLQTYGSISEAAKLNNNIPSNISSVLIKRQKTTKGFIYKYINV